MGSPRGGSVLKPTRIQRRTAIPLLLLAAALGLYLASLAEPRGAEPPPDLVSLAARAVDLVEAGDRALTALVLGGGIRPPEPSEVAMVASKLKALGESLDPAGTLSSRLIESIDAYYSVLSSVYILSSGFTSVSESLGNIAGALDLLAGCYVEEALNRYTESRRAAKAALELLVSASLQAVSADPQAAIAEEHQAVIDAYRSDLSALAEAMGKALALLDAVEKNPDLGRALCKADDGAVYALAARLGTTPGRLASTLYTLSPSLAEKIAEAAIHVRSSSSSCAGAGAGAAEAGSDD